MPFRFCTYTSCARPAEQTFGSFIICSAHFCVEHLSPPFHTCPTEEADPEAFYDAYDAAKQAALLEILRKVNVNALTTIASKARRGVRCSIPALTTSANGDPDPRAVTAQMGGQNCHVDIDFEDGVTWLARLRLDDSLLPPQPTQAYIFASEVATLKFLEAPDVPAPKVFDYEFESKDVGFTFILMEKIKGQPLDWNSATSLQRTRVLEQLVEVFLELEEHPFDMTRSICAGEAGAQIGQYNHGNRHLEQDSCCPGMV